MSRKPLTLYLAKEDVEEYEDLLSLGAQSRLNRRTTRIVEAPDFGDGARLFIFVGDNDEPDWLKRLRDEFEVRGRIETRSSCGLLIFRSADRVFASTYAHGWMYLNDLRLESNFGLRVAVNALDDKKLKRLERANLGDALRGVDLSPFQREFESFGIDDALDLVRKISGSTRDAATADSLAGSTSLKVTGDFEIADLPEIAREALDFFESAHYKGTPFRIIDIVSPVKDGVLVSELDDLVSEQIRDRQDTFELCLPVSYDDDEVSYQFAGPGMRGLHSDLLLRHYMEAMGDRLEDFNADLLRRHRIVAVYGDDRPDQRWPLHSALIGSIVRGGGRYAINEGEWYRVDEAFKTAIEAGFARLVEEWDEPPTPLRRIIDAKGNSIFQSEASYNQEAAERYGFVLLDQTSVPIEGIERSRYEPCDLFDIDGKRFIHVKKSSRRSSVLSHFFKQGRNSAQNFKRFPTTWGELEHLIQERGGEQAVERLRTANDNHEQRWTVEFWIADVPRASGEFNIPFFSKISLRDEVSRLAAMDYRVAIRFIGLPTET